MKKLLLILLCFPMILSCNVEKIKKQDKNFLDFEYIYLPRINGEKEIVWRGLLKSYEVFKIYLSKEETISLPTAYIVTADNRLKLKYSTCTENCPFSCEDQNKCEYSVSDMGPYVSPKSDFYFFSFTNRLSDGADDPIIDRITNYLFIIE